MQELTDVSVSVLRFVSLPPCDVLGHLGARFGNCGTMLKDWDDICITGSHQTVLKEGAM